MEKRAMEELWKLHTDEEFLRHDVEATLATMTDDAFVLNIPTGMGGRGKSEVRAFYRDSFVHFLPSDIAIQLTHRVLGDDALVDEMVLTFTHSYANGLDSAQPAAHQQEGRRRSGRSRLLPRPQNMRRAHLLGSRQSSAASRFDRPAPAHSDRLKKLRSENRQLTTRFM